MPPGRSTAPRSRAWRAARAGAARPPHRHRPGASSSATRPQRTVVTARYVAGPPPARSGPVGSRHGAGVLRSAARRPPRPPRQPAGHPAPPPPPLRRPPPRAVGPESGSRSTTLRAWGTYVFLGTRSAEGPRPAHRLATGVLADIGRACSRFRRTPTWPGSTPTTATGSRSTRSWSPPSRSRARPPPRPTAWSTRCSAASWSSSATTATSGCSPSATTGPAAGARRAGRHPDARPGGGSGSTPTVRSGSRAGTALDLGATAKAWAADVVAAALADELSRLRAGQRRRGPGRSPPRTVSPGRRGLGAPRRRPRPGRRAPRRRPGHLEHAGPALARAGSAATTCSTPAPGSRPPEAWRTVTATGPTCTAANTASTAASSSATRPRPGSRPAASPPASSTPTASSTRPAPGRSTSERGASA